MKTKKMFAMFAAAAMMLTTSCSNDETFEKFDQSGNEAQVTFSLGLENGMNTRAISDGTGINQLFYAIFDKDGNYVKETATNQEVNKFPLVANISLVKGETYTAVFWAWDKNCEAYTIEDNKTVKINYSKIPNNDEDSDAFFKNVTFTVDGNENISIVLKRAFAQLNVGITAENWETATDQGVEITKSTVTIKQAATTLNLLNGTVDGAADITLEADAIPTETLKVDTDCDGEDEEYVYLSMSYFLANDGTDGASKTTVDLAFTFSDDNGNSFVLNDGLANAPVQRNHRTNIIGFGGIGGGIITGDVTVNVFLDPLYDGEHTETSENVWEDYKGIYTEEALAGMDIKIPAGWHIRNGYILEPMPEYWDAESSPLYENSYTINGNGNTVTFEPYAYKFTAKNAFAAADGQEVTVENLIFAGEHFGVFGGVYGGVNGRNGYNTTFNNVQIVNNKIYCYNKDGSHPVTAFSSLGNATLNNCIIKDTKHVGEEKDKDNENKHVTKALAQGVYDILVPNLYNKNADYKTTINNSVIGSIYVKEQGRLIVTGESVVNMIIGRNLVNKFSYINIEAKANVGLIDVTQHPSYSPKVNIKSGAFVGTLQLNDSKATYINIEDGATVEKISWNGTDYVGIDAIAKFKEAAGL